MDSVASFVRNDTPANHSITVLNVGNSTNVTCASNVTNCTDDGPAECPRYDMQSITVLGFIALFVVIFGCTANVMNTFIFTHRFMRTSLLNWYYAALSISDLLVLITGLLRDVIPRLADYNYDWTTYSAMIYMTFGTHSIGCMAQTASIYLTVAMSAHRFVGVCFPFKSSRICTKTNTRICILSVIAFAVVFNFSRFFELTVSTVFCFGREITEVNATELRTDEVYTTIFFGWVSTLIMYVVPFSLLICLNLKVILAIRNTTNLHRRMSVRDATAPKHREFSKEISTSVMLVGVVIVFLVCNTPSFIANLMEVGELVNRGDPVYSKVVDYNNLMVLINCSINCFVYLSFSDKYRALLKHYLSCGCLQHDSEPLIDMTGAQSG